jgi:hypothetical protein
METVTFKNGKTRKFTDFYRVQERLEESGLDYTEDCQGLIESNLPYMERMEHPDFDGDLVETTFLGTVFTLYPSGKFYTPWANSNVSIVEAAKDAIFQECLEYTAEKQGCFVESGEGDPCDIFLSRVVESEEEL